MTDDKPEQPDELEAEAADAESDLIQPEVAKVHDTVILTGEYAEEEQAEDIDISAVPPTLPQLMKVPPRLREMLDMRIDMFHQFEALDQERREIFTSNELSEEARNELTRQQSEMSRLPPGEKAKQLLQHLRDRLASLALQVREGECEPIHPKLAEAYLFAFRQWKLCIDRDQMIPDMLLAGEEAVGPEPLLNLLQREELAPEAMFAWASYATAVDAAIVRCAEERKVISTNLTALDQKNTGILRRLRRDSQSATEHIQKLRDSDTRHSKNITFLVRERTGITPIMVSEYWRVYDAAAGLLLRDDLPPRDIALLRAFLRYGMISSKPWFLTREVSDQLLKDCAQYQDSIDLTMTAERILYADEYIQLVAIGKITPSVNEELELNGRYSPSWHADRMHRRMIGSLFKEEALEETIEALHKRIANYHQEQSEMEDRLARLIRTAANYEQQHAELSQGVQRCKVEAARYQRVIVRIEQQFLPAQVTIRIEAEDKMASIEYQLTPAILAHKEAAAMHRVSRLCARLQDPFPPFALRDNYKLDSDQLNTREEMSKQLREIECADPTIFKEPLMQVKKVSQRVYLRHAPIVLLAPACGFMAYSWNPRAGNELGRLVFPAYCPRPGLRERLLHDAMADFRWDTSKADAGVDLLLSESLVAAYANARWECRHKPRMVREKAAIYTEENDRTNFRRHYSLYLQSAEEGAKKLFFKSREVYNAILKHLILPEGVEKLKK